MSVKTKRHSQRKKKNDITYYYIILFLVPWLSIYAIHQLVGYWLRIFLNQYQTIRCRSRHRISYAIYDIFCQRCSCHYSVLPPLPYCLQGSMKIQIARLKTSLFCTPLPGPLPMMSPCRAGLPYPWFLRKPKIEFKPLPSFSIYPSLPLLLIFTIQTNSFFFYYLRVCHFTALKNI